MRLGLVIIAKIIVVLIYLALTSIIAFPLAYFSDVPIWLATFLSFALVVLNDLRYCDSPGRVVLAAPFSARIASRNCPKLTDRESV